MNRTRRARRKELFHVEGRGRIYEVEPIQDTKNPLGETPYYRSFQLECAGSPEPNRSKMPIQPVRIRCTTWDNGDRLNASLLEGIKDRTRIHIVGYMDPWFQLWGPDGSKRGITRPIPDGGREGGHSRPWETINVPKGTVITETAQLTVTEIEILDGNHNVVTTVKSDAGPEMIDEEIEAAILGIPIEESELGQEAHDTVALKASAQASPQFHDTSKDHLTVKSIIKIKDLTEIETKIINGQKVLKRQFTGIANRYSHQNGNLIKQQPLRLLCRLTGDNAVKVDDWDDETPIESVGYLKALNYVWIPTKKNPKGKLVEIPSPGQPGGMSRPWDIVHLPKWNPAYAYISTFQVVIHEIYKTDTDGIIAKQEKWAGLLKHNDSPEWQAKREKVLKRDGMLCVCGDKATEVHHKTYRNPHQELLSAFVALCRCCYERVYSREKKLWQGSKNSMSSTEYEEYRKSPSWQQKRKEILKRDNNRCICGEWATVVHHKTYKNVGQEQLSDLVVLCENCHDVYHGYLLPD